MVFLWVQQKLHKKSPPLLSAFHPIFKFSRKKTTVETMSPKKHVTENTSPKRSTDPDPTVDRDRDRLAAEANLYEFMKSRVGGPSTDGAVGCHLFFSLRKVLEILCVFLFKKYMSWLEYTNGIQIITHEKKRQQHFFTGEAFWITFFFPIRIHSSCQFKKGVFKLPRPHEN